MRKAILIFILALAGTLVMGQVGMNSALAEQKVKKETLLKTDLADARGKEVTLIYEEVPPAPASLKKNEYPKGGKHYHTGHTVVYMISGSLVLDYEGKPPMTVGAGDIFEELPGQVIQGKNASTTEWARIVVFQIGKKGEPLTVEVK